MYFRINKDTKIKIYDYDITNACLLKFIDTEVDTITQFLKGLGEISYFEFYDENEDRVVDASTMTVEYVRALVEDTTITEYTTKVVEEAYDEVIEGTEEGEESTTIHHDAVTVQEPHERVVEMITAYLETPTVESSISTVKTNVKSVQNDVTELKSALIDPQAVTTLIQMQCDTLTDAQALSVSTLYPDWSSVPDGTPMVEGKRYKYTGKSRTTLLYKVRTAHNKQSDWNPETSNLFEVIEPDHAGTLEDPIPAHANMEYVQGKYYIEDNVIYLCNSELAKDGVVLQYTPSQLIGTYFEVVESDKE